MAPQKTSSEPVWSIQVPSTQNDLENPRRLKSLPLRLEVDASISSLIEHLEATSPTSKIGTFNRVIEALDLLPLSRRRPSAVSTPRLAQKLTSAIRSLQPPRAFPGDAKAVVVEVEVCCAARVALRDSATSATD